jgi:hypothetical protein
MPGLRVFVSLLLTVGADTEDLAADRGTGKLSLTLSAKRRVRHCPLAMRSRMAAGAR